MSQTSTATAAQALSSSSITGVPSLQDRGWRCSCCSRDGQAADRCRRVLRRGHPPRLPDRAMHPASAHPMVARHLLGRQAPGPKSAQRRPGRRRPARPIPARTSAPCPPLPGAPLRSFGEPTSAAPHHACLASPGNAEGASVAAASVGGRLGKWATVPAPLRIPPMDLKPQACGIGRRSTKTLRADDDSGNRPESDHRFVSALLSAPRAGLRRRRATARGVPFSPGGHLPAPAACPPGRAGGTRRRS